MASEKVEKVKSADRALEVMEVLVHAPHGLVHSELANTLKIPKSSLTKILSSLMISGHVKRLDGNTYVPGERWLSLVKASITGSSIDALVQSSLERLVRETGETAGFNMIVGGQVETISTVVSSKQLQFTMLRGERTQPHRMSSGQVILANMSQKFQNAYFTQIASKDSTSPLKDRDTYEATMEAIRKSGFAEVHGFRDGIVGLGCPILSADGTPKASLNVATPEIRFDEENKAIAISSLKSITADLEKRISAWIDPPQEWLPVKN